MFPEVFDGFGADANVAKTQSRVQGNKLTLLPGN